MSSAIVITILVIALILYVITGGADFGAGILEALIPKKRKIRHQQLTKSALGPIWEANHVWLIILVVILFIGFPKIFQQIMLSFHIPLLLMLLGIIVRGCAFAFRYYGTPDDVHRADYSWAFSGASVLVPIFLGVVLGGLSAGYIPIQPTAFVPTYITPWLNPFSMSLGLFTVSIFAYLASAYLIDESTKLADDSVQFYQKLTQRSQLAMVILGGIVLITGSFQSNGLIQQFMSHPVSLGFFIIATLSIGWTWYKMQQGQLAYIRYLAAGQVVIVILAWVWLAYPQVIRYSDGTILTFAQHAGQPTMSMLAVCLVIGALVIFPSLIFLFRLFKFDSAITH